VAWQAETRHATPFAVLGILSRGVVLTGVRYLPPGTPPVAPLDHVAEWACREIDRYLADPEYLFTVPYRLDGTLFQRRVWHEIEGLCGVNCRLKTNTYGEIAARLRSSARAVGGACGANPVPLFVPCHRVLAAGGRLGGFMGGREDFPLTVKRWLLRHEGLLAAAD
jgi:methylated-DNA-[protein]-cysteine S-methyltransferase